MRVQPPTQYADEFHDLSAADLTVPSSPVGHQILAWWKTATATDRRALLHDARTLGLTGAFLSEPEAPKTLDLDDLVETDDDDDDLEADELPELDPDEYEEDYA